MGPVKGGTQVAGFCKGIFKGTVPNIFGQKSGGVGIKHVWSQDVILEEFRRSCSGKAYPQIEIVVKLFRCFEIDRVPKLGFPGRDPGSGRYREVREAHRNRFHLFSSILVSVARSYDQKTKKVNDN